MGDRRGIPGGAQGGMRATGDRRGIPGLQQPWVQVRMALGQGKRGSGTAGTRPPRCLDPNQPSDSLARVSNRVNSLRKVRGISPTGPLRCLAMMSVALPSDSFRSSSFSA